MVIRRDDIFIWIPRIFTPKWKIEIIRNDGTTDTVTNDVYIGEFSKPVTTGIGDFKIKLINPGGKYSNIYTGGETVRFYADLSDATTKKFEGRLDYPQDVITEKGQFLEIEGRHISFSLTEITVTASFSSTEVSSILKTIIDDFLTGFTYTNVNTTTTNATVNWSHKPFWDCVIELCDMAGYDCYVDDSKDFHFFEENSIINDNDAVVEGDNLRQLKGFGKDTYSERNKVIVYGEDENGLPIIYTTGTGTREHIAKGTNINTYEQAKDLGDALLSELSTSVEQGSAITLGLPNVNPGDNIWISSPRQKIHLRYKVIEITHKVGIEVGTWMTETQFEKEFTGTEQLMRKRATIEKQLTKIENPNKLSYSYNFPFDDTTNIQSQSNTQVDEGKLKLTPGSSSGTMITDARTVDSNITQVELRYVGKDLGNTTFEVSVNNGLNWETVTRNTLLSVVNVGKKLKIKVSLNTDSLNVNPEIDSLSLLYS